MAETEQLMRRVTGLSNVPLNRIGNAEAEALAKRTENQWSTISCGPMDRTKETVRKIRQTNPQVNDIRVDPRLGPWPLGAHETKSSEAERTKINRYVMQPRIVPPGLGPVSRQPGKSFNEISNDIVSQLQMEIAEWQPGEKRLNCTSGWQLKILDAFLKSGSPWNRQFNRAMVTRRGVWAPATLLMVTSHGFKVVDRPTDYGLYYCHHASTDYNCDMPGQAKGQASS